jgi:3alpha(or 20beta)-hydroxysteroid dehydrogenase
MNEKPEFRLDGKVALISGGARGQGAAEARLFTELGARVVIGDVLVADGELVAKELGDAACFVTLDVTSETAWDQAVATTIERFGRLDVLVNNAGIALFLPLMQTSLEDYRRVIDINQTGVFLGMKAVVPAMADTGNGSIINISSIEGLVGTPGLIAYGASKFAVRGMTKIAALELAASGIRVNSVHPGAIDTPMLKDPVLEALGAVDALLANTAMGRVGQSEEVARLTAFLASDASSYCTGSEFVIDGGFTAGMTFQLG